MVCQKITAGRPCNFIMFGLAVLKDVLDWMIASKLKFNPDNEIY